MARLLYILALVISVVCAEERLLRCVDTISKPLQQTREPVGIDTGSNNFIPGERHPIKVSSWMPGDMRVMIMAVRTGTNTTVGSFSVGPNTTITTFIPIRCGASNPSDTVIVYSTEQTVALDWIAPEINPEDGKDTSDEIQMLIEFRSSFLDVDGNPHHLDSISMRAEMEPLRPVVVDTPEEEDRPIDHNTKTEDQIKMDMEQKKAEEIDMENQASEDDLTKAELEEERKFKEEQHQEEMEYERLMREEEEDRLARIRAEIRDKEEYDRLMREKEEEEKLEKDLEDDVDKLKPGRDNEVDIDSDEYETAGSTRVVGGISCLLLLLIQALI